jgi:hypothetical protein
VWEAAYQPENSKKRRAEKEPSFFALVRKI